MSIQSLKTKMELDYLERKLKYDLEAEELAKKREAFYLANPYFPFKSMFMQVKAPPQKIIINIIR